jgi:hypothetical protein
MQWSYVGDRRPWRWSVYLALRHCGVNVGYGRWAPNAELARLIRGETGLWTNRPTVASVSLIPYASMSDIDTAAPAEPTYSGDEAGLRQAVADLSAACHCGSIQFGRSHRRRRR